MNSIIYLCLVVSLIANVALLVAVICCLVHISGMHKDMDDLYDEKERDHKESQKIIREIKDGYEKILDDYRNGNTGDKK